MTEEEQQQEVAVWGENMNLMKDCSLEKTDEDMYYNSEWDYTCEESELEPEDKNDPDVHFVEARSNTGMQNVLGLDDPNDRSGTKLVKILSSKAISDCIQDSYLSVKDKPFPCFKENRRMNKLRRKFERL